MAEQLNVLLVVSRRSLELLEPLIFLLSFLLILEDLLLVSSDGGKNLSLSLQKLLLLLVKLLSFGDNLLLLLGETLIDLSLLALFL